MPKRSSDSLSINTEFKGSGSEFYSATPQDMADANKAFANSLQQIKNIFDTDSTILSTALSSLETTKGLDLLNEMTQPIDDATLAYIRETYNLGSGTDGLYKKQAIEELTEAIYGKFDVSPRHRAGRQAATPQLKPRITFDESVVDKETGLRFVDLIETDSDLLFASYVNKTSGAIALTGIGVRNPSDWIKLMKKVQFLILMLKVVHIIQKELLQ